MRPRSTEVSPNCLIHRYSFYAGGLSDMEKVRKAIFMFSDLFGLERYNYNKLVSGNNRPGVIS